uniref:beta-galactosidase-like n=1 Tax=Styela clava TaxID=7725 RepID=UPI001939E607|nr:beta-galactosidase-like [Styela clava]
MNWWLLAVSCSLLTLSVESREFTVDYKNNVFLKDGEPFQYISGCMHYFRVPRYYWRDRLRKMRACGLDAVQTYIPWNFHVVDGSYRFDGEHDIAAFLGMAQEEGLLAIIRGFPFSDTEWDMGGLPSFLLKSKYNPRENPIGLRTSDPRFLSAVKDWLGVILPILKQYLYNNGGPIIMIQIENEYGSYYAQDTTYLKSLYYDIDTMLNENVVLFTTDGDGASYLEHGHIDGVFQTVDFGPGANVTSSFTLLRKFQPDGPLVNSEYYTGWLDHWGENHHRTSSEAICKIFDEMLAAGASVNFYMFTGGTNFGYWSGSNGGSISQVTTSYDYDSPISENGDTMEKYFKIQEVISRYKPLPHISVPPNITTISYGSLKLTNQGSFWDHLTSLCPDGPVIGSSPLSYEDLDVVGGYVLYRTTVPPLFQRYGGQNVNLTLENSVRDHAKIYVNQNYVGQLERGSQTLNLGACSEGDQIDILVESRGRLSVGTGINDTKGIDGKAKISIGTIYIAWLTNWEMYPLNLKNMALNLKSSEQTNGVNMEQVPAIYTGTLFAQTVADTFIDLSGGSWTSGYVLVNGFNLGKFQPKQGPQITLYLPTKTILTDEPILHFTLFEMNPSPTCAVASSSCTINLIDHPMIG